MKKSICSILLFLAFGGFAQEPVTKSFEKFKISAGSESLTYPGYGINTQGYKVQLDVPIYERLGATFTYSKHSPYQDYCDEIPVSATTQYFVAGLNYTFYQKSKWSFAALAAFDIERVRYRELSYDPRITNDLHNERGHQEKEQNHSDVEAYVEMLVGLEVGYDLSERLQINFSTRYNTYGALRNSLSLCYKFSLRNKEKVKYFQ